jgi:hypothetical protein
MMEMQITLLMLYHKLDFDVKEGYVAVPNIDGEFLSTTRGAFDPRHRLELCNPHHFLFHNSRSHGRARWWRPCHSEGALYDETSR